MNRARTDPLLWIALVTIIASVPLVTVPSRLGTVGQLLLGVPLVLLFPGYVVVRLLSGVRWRENGRKVPNLTGRGRNGGTPLVPIAISVGISVAVVPVLVRVVMATWGYSRRRVVLSLAAFVLVGAALGIRRNDGLRNSIGITTAMRAHVERVWGYFDRDTEFGVVTSIVVVLSVLFFLSSVGYAVSGPVTGPAYTEFYLLTENESGELVADDYPTALAGNGSTPLVAGVTNHEHERTTYTFVVEIQRVVNGTVLDERELYRTKRTVEAGETTTIRHRIETRKRGQSLRVKYYLYRGDAPANAGDDAYRTLRLDVSIPERQ